MPTTTARRLLQAAAILRLKLTKDELRISWATVEQRIGYTPINAVVRAELHDWVLAHPMVIVSPITSDKRLVLDPATGQKVRVQKLLRQISVRELHNDMVKPAAAGGLACARNAASRAATLSSRIRRCATCCRHS